MPCFNPCLANAASFDRLFSIQDQSLSAYPRTFQSASGETPISISYFQSAWIRSPVLWSRVSILYFWNKCSQASCAFQSTQLSGRLSFDLFQSSGLLMCFFLPPKASFNPSVIYPHFNPKTSTEVAAFRRYNPPPQNVYQAQRSRPMHFNPLKLRELPSPLQPEHFNPCH